MRYFGVILASMAATAPMLMAGQVYGTVRDASGKAVPNLKIVIVSPAKTAYEGKTGPDGSYQIFVKETGRCEFQAHAGGPMPATANVFSYADPSKYELELSGNTLKVK